MQASGLASDLTRRLLEAAAADGGWAYYGGKASRLEPTAWAILGLRAAGVPASSVAPAVAFLRNVQRTSGLLVEDGLPGPNYAWNGLALLALQAVPDVWTEPWVSRLVQALLEARGVQLPNREDIRQDSGLQGWSWTDGTFSWVEPTAWVLLALKRLRVSGSDARARLAEAEALLRDRACEPAGWNYGNSAVLMQDLRPYVSTTALALLALQDQRDEPTVADGLAWLEASATAERSAMALGLSAIGLTVFGRPVDTVLERLEEQAGTTGFLANAHLEAMALCAMTLGDHDAEAFRLP